MAAPRLAQHRQAALGGAVARSCKKMGQAESSIRLALVRSVAQFCFAPRLRFEDGDLENFCALQCI
jgi:hypothetical protein